MKITIFFNFFRDLKKSFNSKIFLKQSWGIDCGKPGVPGVYVKISKFLPWISQQTGNPIENYWPQN